MLQSYHTANFRQLLANVNTLHLALHLTPLTSSVPLPFPMRSDVHLVPGQRDATGTQGYYLPIIFPNDFWHLHSQYAPINSTTPTLPLRVVFQPMSYFKFQLFASMTHGFNEAATKQGASGGAELDEIKRMLVETNPWFLALTGLVSALHVL